MTDRKSKYPKYEGLSADEREFVNELIDKSRAGSLVQFQAERLDAEFWMQGSFTVCILHATMPKPARKRKGQRVVAEGRTLVGVAKCNRNDDELDAARGRRIALARALRGEAAQT